MLARVVLGVAGILVILGTILSAVRTVVLPRGVPVLLTASVFRASRWCFGLVAGRRAGHARRDAVFALYAPVTLLALPAVWAAGVGVGFALLYGAVGVDSARDAYAISGSSLLTLGFARGGDLPTDSLAFLESLLGLGLVALLIAYLPTIYGHFSRRESMVTLLATRAGSPPQPWVLLERLWAIGWLARVDDLFVSWEQWFIELEESHSSFGALVHFRSPHPDRSWITAAGCMLDTAALAVAILDWSAPGLAGGPRGPQQSPTDPPAQAQLCLRSGFLALRHLASLNGIGFDPDPRRTDPISITRDEFDEVFERLAQARLPLRPDRELAWQDFAGWRVNYDVVLRSLCGLVDPPPAPWSSDRPLTPGRGSAASVATRRG